MAKLREHAEKNAGLVTREYLENFTVGDRAIKLIDQSRGIRNPNDMSCTLSIISAPRSKYGDVEHDNGLIDYAYETSATGGGANNKLRLAIEYKAPIILLRKIATSIYMPVMPVYVVGDDQVRHFFSIAIDNDLASLAKGGKPLAAVLKQLVLRPEFRRRTFPTAQGAR